MIADEQYEKVSKVLSTYHHSEVGIIAYGQLGDELIPGVVRYPKIPKTWDPKNVYRMLWKSELVVIANQMGTRGEMLINIYTNLAPLEGTSNYRGKKPLSNDAISSNANVVSMRLSKEQLIDFIFARLGAHNAYQLIVEMFVQNIRHPDKILKSYHFKKREPWKGELYSARSIKR